jgi:hypothetical protein
MEMATLELSFLTATRVFASNNIRTTTNKNRGNLDTLDSNNDLEERQ